MNFTCLYPSAQAIMKLSQSARTHFLTLIKMGVHLIGHFRISRNFFFKASLSAQFLL